MTNIYLINTKISVNLFHQILSFIENEAIKIQKKNELISFSLSNKNFLEGHKFRIKLLESLKKKN